MSKVWIDDLSGAALLEVTSKKHGTFIAWIDSDDAERVSKHTWCVKMNGRGHVYFHTNIQQPDGKYKGMALHRLLGKCPEGEFAASQKYDCAAIELFGEFASLNHPREWYEFVSEGEQVA